MTRPKLFVTGFGPFAGVEVNPTTLLIDQLREAQAAGKLPVCIERMDVLEVSVPAVTEYVESMKQHVDQASSGPVFYVHFGVNGGGQVVHLERFAYNCADFRVPDQRGLQPRASPIEPSKPLDCPLSSTLNLERIAFRMMQKGRPEVRLSVDPGRFLCNYVYYSSALQHSGRALFVHVPPSNCIAPPMLYDIAVELLAVIADELSQV
jgi:pyroglutamyl-peptidase